MKRHWETEELIDFWTLLPPELEILANKTGAMRLGFAVLLKFFALEGRFPRFSSEIPPVVIEFIAKQIQVDSQVFAEYRWQSRTVVYHRNQIRELFGYREAAAEDGEKLSLWLQHKIFPNESEDEHILTAVDQQFREWRIEPPTADRLERIIHSARRAYEEKFCRDIQSRLSTETRDLLESLLTPEVENPATATAANESGAHVEGASGENAETLSTATWRFIKAEPGRANADSLSIEMKRLTDCCSLDLPENLFYDVPRKVLLNLRRRAAIEEPYELRRHPPSLRQTLLAAFCFVRIQEITDTLVDLLIEVIHRLKVRAERRGEQEMFAEFKRVSGKHNLLFRVAEASLEKPDDSVRSVVYPVVSEPVLRDLVKEWKSSGYSYQQKVTFYLRNSYRSHYRRLLPQILGMLEFRSNNEAHRPVIVALELLKDYSASKLREFPSEESVLLEGVVKPAWRTAVVEIDATGAERVNRINYELCVLKTLRDKLRCKEIWVVGADRYRNPEDDLPADFESRRETYFEALSLPLNVENFIEKLQNEMRTGLETLNRKLPKNPDVKISTKKNGWIHLSPLEEQTAPSNILRLKTELNARWGMTSLLDVLKETDLRTAFSETFKSPTAREALPRDILQPRLLLCLYGLGTNTGIKRMNDGEHGISYKDLLYVRRRYLHKDHLREAIRSVVNATFQARQSALWGGGTTACASDSKKFGAWDQNLLTEWHIRYGGRGVMIYWHVERKATCIYSQLKNCSSSEVAAMIEGVLRHCTEMTVTKQYVDSHGQSEVAFAFCRLLGFELMPRLRAIHSQKLYRIENGKNDDFANLQPVLTRAIDWKLIRQQYQQMVKYATALRLGTAETEAILRRFTRLNVKHPTYWALAELGKAIKTIFLCRYLDSMELRREIHEGLNVIENWNGANNFIFYGRSGEFATNSREDQETAMLALHLLQISLVYINTLMIQRVLNEPEWQDKLQAEDLRALTPLVYTHVTPYGQFRLDMKKRIEIESLIETA